MSQVYQTVITTKVEFVNRQKLSDVSFFDHTIGFLFVLNFFISLGIGAWTITSSSLYWDEAAGDYYFSPAFLAEVQNCLNSNPSAFSGRRELALMLAPSSSNVYKILAKYPEVPAVILCSIPFIAVLWILAMRFATFAVTWLSLLMSIAMWFVLGAFLYPSEVSYVLFAAGGLIFLFYVVSHKKISESIHHLSVATVAISRNKDILPVTVLIKAAYFGYLTLFAFSLINATFIYQVNPITCYPMQHKAVSSILWYLIFSVLWVSRYSDAMRLTITSMVVASWYFEQPQSERGSYPAFRSFKLIAFRSIGTLSIASVIGAIADLLIRVLRSNIWFLDPVSCFLYLLAVLFRQMILTATTFTTIAHAITSQGFGGSGKLAYDTLKRNFVGGFVNDSVGETVVKINAYYISVALFFACWAWFGKLSGLDSLSQAANHPGFLYFLIIIGFIYLNRYPFLSLIVVNFLSSFYYDPVVPALFVSSIAHIILSYFGSVILDAMNTLFFCHAISRDNHFVPVSDDKAEVKKLLDEMPKGIVLADPGLGGQAVYAQPVYGQSAIASYNV